MADAILNNYEESQLFGHPKDLFHLLFAELWECFSFYGMRALLMLYMTKEIFEALAEKDVSAAAVYVFTVIESCILDKILGMQSSIFLVGILMPLGHFVLAIENDIAFFMALAFIVVGSGFFKPKNSTFVGSLYKEGDRRKDSGFTIFYMGINIGGFVAPLLCGWLAASYGWHYGFGLAGIGMLTGLVFFWSGIKSSIFGDRGLPPSQEIYNKNIFGIPQKTFVPIVSFLCAPIVAYLLYSYKAIAGGESFLGDQNYVGLIFKILGVGILIYMGVIIYNSAPDERKKLIMVLLITFFMTLFWGFHELSGSVITLFTDRNVDLSGIMNASQTNVLNSLAIIVLSIPISLLWAYLSKKNLNPRTPYKFGLGLVLAGVSFYILSISGGSADENGMVPFVYLFIMYFIISIGELFMSPVGLLKITDLSPKRIVAFMMGVWFLSSAYAFQIVGFISKELAVESTDVNVGGIETLQVYIDGFSLIAKYSIGGGIAVLIFSPLMKKLMGNVH